jgi:DNA repair protein RadC
MGAARSAIVIAAFELARRIHSVVGEDAPVIRSPQDVADRMIPKLRHLNHEVFLVLVLDSSNHITKEVMVTKGLLNSSLTHPREVFRAAIIESAASIILIHNHPSGNTEPSAEDMTITHQLVESGKILGIAVHDHIIIAGNGFTSFAERGILN